MNSITQIMSILPSCRRGISCRALCLCLLGIALAQPPIIQGQMIENFTSGSLQVQVPDDFPDRLQSATSVLDVSSPASEILQVELEVTVQGGFNGDLYLSLSHGSG